MKIGTTHTRRGFVVAAGVGVLALAGGVAARATASSPTAHDRAATTQVEARTFSTLAGGVSGGTVVNVTGTGLDSVQTVTVAGTAATITHRTADRLRFVTPPAAGFAPATATVDLLSRTGIRLTAREFRYGLHSAVDRQLHYVLTYWKSYNPAYTTISGDDCVDFTSQGLLARGWVEQGDWTSDAADIYGSGAAWRSSTSLMYFMQEHPELGTALSDDERAKVKPGDIVQFCWSGASTTDRDHTGTVTRVTTVGDQVRIDFAGHTDDSDFRSVDTAITVDHPGGAAYYWSLT